MSSTANTPGGEAASAGTAAAHPAPRNDATPKKKSAAMKNLQKLGRSLMLPIAVLPAAALLLRLGQADMLGRWEDVTVLNWLAAILAAGGGALFDNLPLLFAVGVAIGWAKKADGSTALAAVVGYLVLTGVFKALSPMVLVDQVDHNGDQLMINYGVLAGLSIGLVSAILWQKYHRTRLPEYLGFFNGRRFVPIVVGFAAVIIAIPMVLVYPWFNQGLTWFGDMISDNTVGGGFIYGTVNRLLIPIGLHHLLNFVPWFMLGSFEGDTGVVHGDIARFLAGDPTAGAFMTGFFPIMMFALPAAALAMYHTARPAQKKITGGAMVSLALTAFLTGITEPLEVAFMFLAWPLYVAHAVLTGSSLAVMNLIGARDGFGFSAGAIDFLLNLGIAEKPWAIIVAGLIYAVIYYVIFRFMIVKLDLKTPGRDPEQDPAPEAGAKTEAA